MFPFEIEFLKLLESIRTPFLNTLFECITALGEEALLIVLMAIIYFCYDKALARKIFFITAVSIGTNSIIKNFVRLPRPFAGGKVSCVRPETATGYSFPSGHTQTFATWSNTLAGHFKRAWWCILAIVLTLLVAFSRLYLGAHYPSDVIVGVGLGFLFAYAGGVLYEKIKNKNRLYVAAVLLFLPFAIYFALVPDTQYADFFKFYGLLVGFLFAVLFEERFVRLDCNTTVIKKVVRVLIATALSMLIKEALKKLFVCDNLQLSLLLDGVRYFALAFTILGLCPWIFKKIKL